MTFSRKYFTWHSKNSVSIAKNIVELSNNFQKDFPEDGHNPELVGKLYIFVNYMTLYSFFPVNYI